MNIQEKNRQIDMEIERLERVCREERRVLYIDEQLSRSPSITHFADSLKYHSEQLQKLYHEKGLILNRHD